MKNYLCAYIFTFCVTALKIHCLPSTGLCVCIYNNIVDHYENGLFPLIFVGLFVYVVETVIISAHLWLNRDLHAEQASININFYLICTHTQRHTHFPLYNYMMFH